MDGWMDGRTLLEISFFVLTLKSVRRWGQIILNSYYETMLMDIMSYTEARMGLILTLYWSRVVQSSRYVILGNTADGTYNTQWLLSNKHIFSIKYRRAASFFVNMDLVLKMFLLPHSCEATTSQVAPWPYP